MSRKKLSKRDFDEQFEAFLKDVIRNDKGGSKLLFEGYMYTKKYVSTNRIRWECSQRRAHSCSGGVSTDIESASSEDSFDSSRINKFLEAPKKESRPWWDDDEDDGLGTGTGKSFLKARKSGDEDAKKPPTKQKQSAGPKPKARKDAKTRVKTEASISKDSLEDISEKSEEEHHDYNRPRVHIPDESNDSMDTAELLNASPHKLGMDTLDELADKEKFFRDLENQADGTVDYRRLNQELSVTANTMSPEGAAKTAATLAALQDIEDEENYEDERRPGAPMPIDHVQSEREYSEQKPSMLSKVSLMDSLESTMNTTTSPQVGKGTLRDAGILEQDEDDNDNARGRQSMTDFMMTAGTGMMGTNTSQEIEALHRALKEVGLSGTLGNDSQLDISSQGDKGTTADLVQKLLNTSAKTGKQRNFAEIMAELEQIQKKQQEDESRMIDIPLPAERRSPKSPKGLERQRQIEDYEEVRGFDLSPVHPIEPVHPADQDFSQGGSSHRGEHSQSQRGDYSHSHRGGFETSHTEDTEMYQPVTQVSVTERSRKQRKKDQKSDKKKTDKKLEQTADSRTGRDSKVRRSRSNSPRKSEKTGKPKFERVKSSGYGNMSPGRPPRDSSREKDFIGFNITKAGRSLKQDHKRSPVQSPGRSDLDYRSPPSKVPKPTTEIWSPAEISKQKFKGTQSPQQARKGTSGTMKASQLQASIESFTQYIKDHFGKRAAELPQMKYSVDEPSVSTSFKEKMEEKTEEAEIKEKDEIIARLKVQLESVERSCERRLETQKLEYEEQIYQLRQENFVLNAKISGEGENETKKKILEGESLEGVSKEDVSRLEKEMKEQETLIAGYQQENKRLYNELKNVQKQHKQTEEKMFKENQKLLAEASNLRGKTNAMVTQTQLEKKEEQYKNKGIITGPAAQQQIAAGNTAGAVNILEAELTESKRTTDALKREMMILQESRVELEKHIEKLVKEREELNKKIEESKTMKSEEARALEAKHQDETDKLNRKLKWYAENQEILDKSAKQLKKKDDEIHKYKLRIEELQTESGKRVEDSKVRARERAADNKKIQDLQRQVKEMEQILKRRNPNALPTLIMAAAAAPDNTQPGNRSAYTEVLEKRVKKLEVELEQKDGEADTLLRGVEQKYNAVKLQYEERIKDLELQLAIYQGQTDHVHPHTHAVALERELESVRERYKQQVKDLQADVDRLTSELGKSKKVHEATFRVETQSAKETETELRALVKSLQLEVENKTHDAQVMQKSLERLRKEKQISMTYKFGDGKKTKQKGRSRLEADDPEFFSLPVEPSANEKEYEPKDFESTHINDVVQENEELKMKVDHLQLQLDQQRVGLQKSLAETEAMMRRNREDYEEKIESFRVNHQKEVQRILAQQALEHSASRLAEMQSKLDTQEVMIKHLREQQARLEVEAEAAAVLRIKQTRLEETLKSLNNDLKEAKKSHSPEMRHFEALQDKITQIENKHSQREQELQQIIRNTRQNTNIEIEREVDKWKKLVETKNNEIQKFRMELDTILEVLRVLQKQGVVIPVGSVGVS